jgi:predicted metal-dependent hydrolase
MPSITLRDRRIEYSVVRGRSRRYTYFRFKPDATLEVVVPRSGAFSIEPAIREREAWVLKHHDKLVRSIYVMQGDYIVFDGRRLKILFELTGGAESLRPDPESGVVTISASAKSSIRELIRRWFLKESSSYVTRTLPALAKRLGVRYSRADVREIREWGYCTKDGRLSFGWQLIALPERLREYVLYHELVHLSERNHSASFKAKLASVLPDYRERESDLDRVVPVQEDGASGYN